MKPQDAIGRTYLQTEIASYQVWLDR